MSIFKRKFRLLALVLVPMIVQMTSFALADDNQYTRASLKGVSGAHVKVRVSSKLKMAGIIDEQIKKGVEEKLSAAGIKVLNESERTKAAGRPLFEVRISGSKLPKPKIIIYTINLFLFQDVILKREQSTILSAPTWSRKITGESSSIDDVYDLTKIGMDMFLKSYGFVNPK
jgi:hypothetical protein